MCIIVLGCVGIKCIKWTVRPRLKVSGLWYQGIAANSPSCLSVEEEVRFLAPLSASSRSELRRESEAPATFDMDVDLKNIHDCRINRKLYVITLTVADSRRCWAIPGHNLPAHLINVASMNQMQKHLNFYRVSLSLFAIRVPVDSGSGRERTRKRERA